MPRKYNAGWVAGIPVVEAKRGKIIGLRQDVEPICECRLGEDRDPEPSTKEWQKWRTQDARFSVGDTALWRVDGFNAFDTSGNVVMSLSRIASKNNPREILEKREKIVGPIGLCRFLVGSTWSNGELVTTQRFDNYYENNLSYSDKSLQYVRLEDVISLSPSLSNTLIKQLSMDRDIYCLAIAKNGDPYHLVIPAFEIIRFYYCGSLKSANLVGMAIDHDVSPESLLWSGASGFTTDGNLGICLKHYGGIGDLRLLANYGTSRYTRNAWDWVYKSVVQNKIRHGKFIPMAYPPFTGIAELHASGISFEGSGRKRFFVLRIESASFPVPGKKIIYCWSSGTRKAFDESLDHLALRFSNPVKLHYAYHVRRMLSQMSPSERFKRAQ